MNYSEHSRCKVFFFCFFFKVQCFPEYYPFSPPFLYDLILGKWPEGNKLWPSRPLHIELQSELDTEVMEGLRRRAGALYKILLVFVHVSFPAQLPVQIMSLES